MGYRPSIICDDFELELGKFYGYVKLKGLKSIKWLMDHNKIDEPKYFNYINYGPSIRFTAAEFREFIFLYQEDVTNYYGPVYSIKSLYPEYDFEKALNNEKDKIIEWG